MVRRLAAHLAEVAAQPVQAEKRRMWARLNHLELVRPMVWIKDVSPCRRDPRRLWEGCKLTVELAEEYA